MIGPILRPVSIPRPPLNLVPDRDLGSRTSRKTDLHREFHET